MPTKTLNVTFDEKEWKRLIEWKEREEYEAKQALSWHDLLIDVSNRSPRRADA